MFEYINKDGITCRSSFGIEKIPFGKDDEYRFVNRTQSVHEIFFVGTYEECELYQHYFNQHMYNSIMRNYVRNIRDLKIWIA